MGKTRILTTIAAAATVCAIAVSVAFRGGGVPPPPEDAPPRDGGRERPKAATAPAKRPVSAAVAEAETQQVRTMPRASGRTVRTPELTTDMDAFRATLDVLFDSADNGERKAAFDALDALSASEKLHWLGEMFDSGDAAERGRAMRSVRMFFSEKHHEAKAGMRTLSDWRGGDAKEKIDALSQAVRPTAEEAAQLSDLVGDGLKDPDREVWQEALDAAAAFDTTTCNDLYMFAMHSAGDDARLAVLENAVSGDPEFRLFLEFTALDAGGGKAAEKAASDIEALTGRRFSGSAEAFEWYEENGPVGTAGAAKDDGGGNGR